MNSLFQQPKYLWLAYFKTSCELQRHVKYSMAHTELCTACEVQRSLLLFSIIRFNNNFIVYISC